MKILNINIRDKSHVYIGLTAIKGIGISTSKKILDLLKIEYNIKIKDLTEQQIIDITTYIQDNILYGVDVDKEQKNNIDKLRRINCRRGMRHNYGLPINSRTKSNSRTTRLLARRNSSTRIKSQR